MTFLLLLIIMLTAAVSVMFYRYPKDIVRTDKLRRFNTISLVTALVLAWVPWLMVVGSPNEPLDSGAVIVIALLLGMTVYNIVMVAAFFIRVGVFKAGTTQNKGTGEG